MRAVPRITAGMALAAASLAGARLDAARFYTGDREMPAPLAAPKPPFYGIKSKGRRGATYRANLMAKAFDKTPVGKRNARGRATGKVYLRRVELNTVAS